jgi:hypothetical protein
VSLVQDCGNLPSNATINDCAHGGDISVIVNAEAHGQCMVQKEISKEIQAKREILSTLQSEFTYPTMNHDEIDSVIAKYEFVFGTNSLSFREEKNGIAYLRALKHQKNTLIPTVRKLEHELRVVRRTLDNNSTAAMKTFKSLDPSGALWDEAEHLFHSWHHLFCSWCVHCQCELSLEEIDGIYALYADSEADSEDDMREMPRERPRRYRNIARKQPCETSARLRRSGKVRPRGGRHKTNEWVNLRLEMLNW